MKLFVFTFPTYNALKALLTAQELGLAYDLVQIDASKRENRAAEHVARHPLGKIPVLEHDGRTLFESMAIVRYLQTLSTTSLDGDDRHVTDQWSEYSNEGPGRAVGVLYRQEIIFKKMNGIEPDLDAVASALKQLNREFKPLDDRLATATWIGGNVFSVADIVAASYVQALSDTSYELDTFSNLAQWYGRVIERPAFVRALAHFSI